MQIQSALCQRTMDSLSEQRLLYGVWVCTSTSLRVWAHLHEGQRLNKDGKWVCVTLVISLNTQTEMWWVLVSLCFSANVGKEKHTFVEPNTHEPHKKTHAHTLLLYIPQGDCACHILSQQQPNKGAFTPSLCCSQLSLTSQRKLSERKSRDFLGPNQATDHRLIMWSWRYAPSESCFNYIMQPQLGVH